MISLDWSWFYNIILTTLVSSIVAIVLDRFFLNTYKLPKTDENLCGEFYWKFRDYLQAKGELGDPTGGYSIKQEE